MATDNTSLNNVLQGGGTVAEFMACGAAITASKTIRFAENVPINLYKSVVDDVIKNVKDEFLNDGVDQQVLEELKQIWMTKVKLSNVLARPKPPDTLPPPPEPKPQPRPQLPQTHPPPPPLTPDRPTQPPLTVLQAQQGSVIHRALPRSIPTPSASTPPPLLISSIAGMPSGITMATTTPANQTAAATAAVVQAPTTGLPFLPMNLMNPTVGQLATFQQGLVPVPTSQGGVQLVPLPTFVMMQQALQQQQQQQQQQQDPQQAVPDQSGLQLEQTDGLPPLLSAAGGEHHNDNRQESYTASVERLVLEHLETEGEENRERTGVERGSICSSPNPVPILKCSELQVSVPDFGDSELVDLRDVKLKRCRGFGRQHARNRRQKGRGETIVQLDGATGGGGKGGGGSSSEESEGDDSSEDEELAAQEADGDEPLNSDDDEEDSDGEGTHFDTEDTIVCQFEKVFRVKNRWKFHLKDGVMHIGGHDYVFNKSTGEADW